MATLDVTVTRDLPYAEVDGQVLLADLYRPVTSMPPVVVYVHGGGWAVGSRSDSAQERLASLAAYGVAVLSIDYRLSDVAHFPAQLHDVKAAVRWTRAHAGSLDVAAHRVGIWGASAGAVLAALTGLTANDADMTGAVGRHADQPSDVQAVVAWFGAADLRATSGRSWLEAQLTPDGPEAAFLGVRSLTDVLAAPELARRASPLSWVSSAAPPFLVAHGDRDRVVSVTESQALHDALTRAGASSSLLLLGGAGHEDAAFDRPTNIALTAAFLSAALGTG